MRGGLQGGMERRTRSGEDPEDFEVGEPGETQESEYRKCNPWYQLLNGVQRFCKEVIVWRHLPCPYVLRFNGVFYHNGAPAIVTPWMENGNINEYLEKHPEANQFRLVRLAISSSMTAFSFPHCQFPACVRYQRGQVPPQWQYRTRRHQRGETLVLITDVVVD